MPGSGDDRRPEGIIMCYEHTDERIIFARSCATAGHAAAADLMLTDMRVIDTTRLLPGPYAGWLLASMGADVVKVERPGKGDYIRHNWPRRGDVSTVFHLYNRGKRSVALDLQLADGRDAFLDLVAGADVVLDGNRPGVLDRLGCGYEACRRRNEAVVFGAITGFGQDGPYRLRAGHDINYLALSGVLSAVVDERGWPVRPRVTLADMAGGGLMGLVGILGALIAAKRTGQGRFVDISMTDAMLSMQGLRIAEGLAPGASRPPDEGPVEDNDWECGVYETADGRHVSLDPYERRFKDPLWEIVERESGVRRPPRQAGREEVHQALAAAIRTRPRDHWHAQLDGEDVCYAPVLDLHDLPSDPNVAARRSLGDVLDPTVASPGLGSPLKFSPPAGERELGSAPELGQHTREVLSDAGWDAARIEAAISAGAIAVAGTAV